MNAPIELDAAAKAILNQIEQAFAKDAVVPVFLDDPAVIQEFRAASSPCTNPDDTLNDTRPWAFAIRCGTVQADRRLCALVFSPSSCAAEWCRDNSRLTATLATCWPGGARLSSRVEGISISTMGLRDQPSLRASS